MFSNPWIFIGVFLFAVVPSPNCPYVFEPNEYTFPSLSNNKVCVSPADISIIFSLSTFVGLYLLVKSPNPSCPLLFNPHVHTVPSDFNATV